MNRSCFKIKMNGSTPTLKYTTNNTLWEPDMKMYT